MGCFFKSNPAPRITPKTIGLSDIPPANVPATTRAVEVKLANKFDSL